MENACEHEWQIGDEDHGQEIAEVLKKKLPEFSKKAIKRLIDSGAVSISGLKVLRGHYLLSRKDRVHLYLPPEDTSGENSQILLYEDEYILAISKPPGIVTQQKQIEALISRDAIYLVHRLDADTSGVLLLAKNPEIQKELEQLFRERKVQKTYLALTIGKIEQKKGSIKKALIVEKSGDKRDAIVRVAKNEEKALSAHTDWEALITSPEATFLQVFPYTGRTHQIRVHLSSIGHPLIGEKKYNSDRKEKINFFSMRHMLHAYKIEFFHPITKKSCIVYNQVPLDMKSMIYKLFGASGDAVICELS